MRSLPILIVLILPLAACSQDRMKSNPRSVVVTEEGNPTITNPPGQDTGGGGTGGTEGGSGTTGGTTGGTTTSGGTDGGTTGGGSTGGDGSGGQTEPHTIKFCNVLGVEQTKIKYDTEGRVIYEELDRSADGDVDQIILTTYDDRGNLATKTYQNPLDGEVVESVETYTNAYDEGRVTDQEMTINGAFFRSTNFLYDGQGRLQKERIDQGDPALEYDEIIVYFYLGDSTLPQMKERTDWYTEPTTDPLTGATTVTPRNMVIDRTTYTYEGDRLTVTQIDNLGVGATDTRIVHTYDENGRLIRDSYHIFLESDDNVEDTYCTYTYH